MSDPVPLPPVLPPAAHERLSAPRTLLAGLVFLLFGFVVVAPYYLTPPPGSAVNLILTNGETLKAIALLVIGFYFGTSQSSTRKDEVIAAQVAPIATVDAPPATPEPVTPAPAPPAGAPVVLQPGESVTVDAAAGPAADPDWVAQP